MIAGKESWNGLTTAR